jgi:hypothetical protein
MSEQEQAAQPEKEFQPVVMGIDPRELTVLVASIVGEALKPILEKIGAAGKVDHELLGQSIGRNVASGIASTQRRKVSIGEYLAKPHSPNRKDISVKLTRVCCQNGFYLSEAVLTDEEILLFNALTHSGRYCDRFVEVAVIVNGADTEVDLRFPNATADQRFALREHVEYSPRRHRSVLQAMLEMIVEEQKLERSEKEVEDAMRAEVREIARERLNRNKRQEELNTAPAQGHIGRNKAYLEAKAKADAKEAATNA